MSLKFGKRLTEAERTQIQVLSEEGYNNNEISKKMGCGLTTIKRWKTRLFGNVGNMKGQGRKSIISKQKRNKVVNLLKSGNSLRETSHKIKCSKSTIHRLTRNKEKTGNKYLLFPYKIKTKPLLTTKQKQKRYQYALAMLQQNKRFYKHTVFMDEKPWVFHEDHNRQNNRRWIEPERKHLIDHIEKTKHATVVNTFGAIHYQGKSELRFYVDKTPLKKKDKRNKKGISILISTSLWKQNFLCTFLCFFVFVSYRL